MRGLLLQGITMSSVIFLYTLCHKRHKYLLINWIYHVIRSCLLWLLRGIISSEARHIPLKTTSNFSLISLMMGNSKIMWFVLIPYNINIGLKLKTINMYFFILQQEAKCYDFGTHYHDGKQLVNSCY